MKKITTGIFAAIALLTMSFTMAEQKGAFKAPLTPELCITSQDATTLQVGATTYQRGVQACTEIPLNQCGIVSLAEDDFECDGEDVFCCAKITSCPGSLAKIQRVMCQE